MKKNVSSTTASTEASSLGVAVSTLYGSLTSVLTTCTRLPALSPPAARAMFSAASFACCTGLVSFCSFGARLRSSRGASRTHSPAGCTSCWPSNTASAMPLHSTASALMNRGMRMRCSRRMIGLPTRAKNIDSSTGRIRSWVAHNTKPTASTASTTSEVGARGRG